MALAVIVFDVGMHIGWRRFRQATGLRAVHIQDPGGASLRRAARVAIVVPPMAAFAGTIGGELAQPLAAVAAAQSPWWR